MRNSKGLVLNINRLILPIYFMLLLYMMFSTFENAFEISLPFVDYSISSLIPVILFITHIPVLFARQRRFLAEESVRKSFVFCIYILIRIITTNGNGTALITSFIQSFSWLLFMLIPFIINESCYDYFDDIVKIAIVGLILGTIVYFNNIRLVPRHSLWLAMATNSVFYILALVPYILCIKTKIIKNILLIISILIIIYSNKATAFVAMVVVLTMDIYNGDDEKKRNGLVRIIIVAFIISIAFFLFRGALGNTGVIRKLTTIEETGATHRIPIYISVWNNFLNASFTQKMFGLGFNGSSMFVGESAHSDFLEILLNYGIIGLILFLAMIYSLIKKGISLKKCSSEMTKPYMATIIIFLTLTTASNNIFVPRYFLIITFFWGLCFTMFKYKREEAVV